MKTKSAFLLGCSVFLIILVVAFFLGMRYGKGPNVHSVGSDSWLVLDLKGEVPDYNEVRGSSFWGFGSPSSEDICRKIRQAGTDPKVKGIVIKPFGAVVGYANLNEIAAALKEFKAHKKPVLAHGEMLAQRDYLLCAMADKINMDPSASGALLLEGVSANVLFYKDALAKLGIKMHVMQSGEYKGAAEPYTQTSLSPGTEANLRRVLQSRYELVMSDIGNYRQLDSTLVRNVFETRPDLFINAQEALKFGLIDQTGTWDAFAAQNKIADDKCVSIADYANTSEPSFAANKIAVVNLSGSIAPGVGFASEAVISAAKVDGILDDITEDSSVKAVVLRVNSPGGSALESEMIYQKLQALKVPLVVSMGGMAASGGYYISCAGDYIFADPQTITGSIGVIMALPEAEELGNKLGLESQTLSYGKFANFGSILEKYDEELLASLKRNSTEVYTEFQQRVMDSRKISAEEIGAVAEGRVFSAADAKAMRLIDEIGGLDEAVKKAASLAKVTNYSAAHYPRKISFFEMFRSNGWFQMAVKMLSGREISVEQRLLQYLEQAVPTRTWLYFCPFRLD